MKKYKNYLKIISVLWILWGVVHIFAGILTMKGYLTGDITAAISGIADAVDSSSLQMNYPQALGAILAQHGFNLLWGGIVTVISAFYIWIGNKNALILAGMIGGLLDLGYFIFMDIGGFVNFIPGTVMTMISGTAIVLSIYIYNKDKKSSL